MSGGHFEIRVDSRTGPLLGTATVLNTDGFDTYTGQSTPIAFTKGVHDVYLVAVGGQGIANIDSFALTRPTAKG
ncbi:carbohydrate-binding protein [Streptomyces sp. NBC_01497]|uniref:carbohydrate-binding protein n=1 Tax=Streptomyces sp. NBC_01497 TaxID=2903885 RepID=UPI002E339E3C|nr:carbohydrate-binding protein [Streptomyces sp. NBC_01497]